MSVELRLPNITATNTEGQVAQMQSYMHQLVQQLNWALSTIDTATQTDASNIALNDDIKGMSPEEAENTFNSIKSLIIKSADIVKAYEDTLTESFSGKYVAQSDFGTYLQETKLTIETDSKTITEYFENLQEITGSIEDEIKDQEAYIKRGELEDGVYGIEVGETNDEGVYKRYARFTADKLTFFDGDSNDVAYVGSNCLHIVGKAEFFGEIQMGKYKIDTSDGLAFTWVG